MDFFSAQDAARKRTGRLIFLFLLAILALVCITNLLVMGVFGYFQYESGAGTKELFNDFDWDTFINVGVGVVVIVLLGSVYKVIQLSGGGRVVAEMLGGSLICPNTTVPSEKRLLNVVEEMAIASGTSVPSVYLLKNESTINAFAAGFSANDAVIGVTQGTLELLSRDELQGVIAHEFSHVLNGDMRLNIRLIGIISGILLLSEIGYYFMRGGSRSRDGAAIAILGLGLMLVGFAGTFFGGMIKASINRQREYLADASAVQYTRDPSTISGALKKIGASHSGSLLNSPAAPEMSHAFFSEGVSNFMVSAFASHPPLVSRIKRVEPSWDGVFPEPESIIKMDAADSPSPEPGHEDKLNVAGTIAVAAVMASVDNYGHVNQGHIGYARELLHSLPVTIMEAAHEPSGARAIIYAMVINEDQESRKKQLQLLERQGDIGVYDETRKLLPIIDDLKQVYRLPTIDLAMPALRQLSFNQYQKFKTNLDGIIAADNKISVFEWVLQKIINKHLDGAFTKQQHFITHSTTLKKEKNACAALVSTLVYVGKLTSEDAEKAFSAAVDELGLKGLSLLPRSDINLNKLNDAVETLTQIKPLNKPLLLKACVACISSDGYVSVSEIELLRAVADILDCPMPPVVNNIKT